jgi:hypothetical protein
MGKITHQIVRSQAKEWGNIRRKIVNTKTDATTTITKWWIVTAQKASSSSPYSVPKKEVYNGDQ